MSNANANQSKKSSYNPFENMGSMPNFMNYIPNFMDFGSMRQQYSKNIEACTEANQVILDFSKEAARRVTEAMQKNAQCIYDCTRETIASRSPEEFQKNNSNMIASVMNNNIAQVKEAADISSKATKEILDTYSKRMSEACNN